LLSGILSIESRMIRLRADTPEAKAYAAA